MDGRDDEIKYKRLFRAVLMQAAKDAFILHGSSLSTINDKKSASMFLKGGEDLQIVCDIACVDERKITNIMKNLSKNNNTNFLRIKNEIC